MTNKWANAGKIDKKISDLGRVAHFPQEQHLAHTKLKGKGTKRQKHEKINVHIALEMREEMELFCFPGSCVGKRFDPDCNHLPMTGFPVKAIRKCEPNVLATHAHVAVATCCILWSDLLTEKEGSSMFLLNPIHAASVLEKTAKHLPPLPTN